MGSKGGLLSGVSLSINLLILISGLFFTSFNGKQVRSRITELTEESFEFNTCNLILTNMLSQDFSHQSSVVDSLSYQKLDKLYENVKNEINLPYGEKTDFTIEVCEGSIPDVKKCLSEQNSYQSCFQRVFDIDKPSLRGISFIRKTRAKNRVEDCYLKVGQDPCITEDYCNRLASFETCYDTILSRPETELTEEDCRAFIDVGEVAC